MEELTWRGTRGTKGSSAYQKWSSEEEHDSAQKPISPSRKKSEFTSPPGHPPWPPDPHTCAVFSSQNPLAHKPDSCLHRPCQAHQKSTRILRPNFPFAPRRRTLMKRPLRRRQPALWVREDTGVGRVAQGIGVFLKVTTCWDKHCGRQVTGGRNWGGRQIAKFKRSEKE